MIRKLVLVGSIFALVSILGIASISAQLRERRGILSTALPAYDALPAFSLIDTDGSDFTQDNLAGKITVADFIFTSCSGPCPVMSSRMDELEEAFASHDGVQFMSVSVNPEVDTPEVLKAYGERYRADLSRWHFLTGDGEAIQKLAVEGFKIGATDDILIHSTKFVLLDRTGRIRGYYTGTESQDLLALSRDIGRLLHER